MKLYSAPLRSRLQIRAPYLEAAGTEATLKETTAWKYRPSVITDDDGIVLESNGLDREATRPQRIGGWHVDGWIETGSCRVVIDGDYNGRRFLGYSPDDPREFCVFAPSYTQKGMTAFEDARNTARFATLNNPNMTYEIHQYRATGKDTGEWVAEGAGVSPSAA